MLPIILAIKDKDDQNYVADIYERYSQKLFEAANQILKNEQDSLDCVQEVIIVLIQNLQHYRTWDKEHQKGYLLVCCRNLAINKYKKKSRQLAYEVSTTNYETREEIDIVDDDSNVETIVVSNENKKIIQKMIDSMDPKYGTLVFFRYLCDMRNKDIAKVLGLPIGTVNVRLSRAKKELASMLEKEGL